MCSSITGGAGSAVVLAASLVLAGALSTGPLRAADAIQIETAARAMQPGEVVLFTITPPAAATRVSVHAFGRDIAAIRIDARTWRALVGIDLATGSGPADTTAVAETASGEVTKSYPITILPKRFPTRRLTVDPRLVEPPVSELPRIQRETARTNAIYASPAPLALWSGPFVRPVADPANSRFGSRSIFNGTRSSPHTGADFLSGAGTPIKAPNAGRVRLAENLYFSGNTVIVDHGLGLFSLFAHLSAFQVHEGDEVITGQVLGLVGATGRVTGPHLHWAMRATGARIDPLSLLAVLGR
jgi:hypothetical protein